MKKRAVVLVSGGLDSSTTLFYAKEKGYECRSLIFDYGQRHRRELAAARYISRAAGAEYRVLKISLPWQGSALLDMTKRLPKGRSPGRMKANIPSSYVPARNTIFLSFALSFAEAIRAEKIFFGANAVDFSGYPDCRPSYFKAFRNVIREGTRTGQEGAGISVEVPLLFKTKAEIIKEGTRLGVPYGRTWSCYEGGIKPCGVCDSCVIRKMGFKEAGVEDPLTSDG